MRLSQTAPCAFGINPPLKPKALGAIGETYTLRPAGRLGGPLGPNLLGEGAQRADRAIKLPLKPVVDLGPTQARTFARDGAGRTEPLRNKAPTMPQASGGMELPPTSSPRTFPGMRC